MTSTFRSKRIAPVVLSFTVVLTLTACLSEMQRFPTQPVAQGTTFIPSFIPVVAPLQGVAKQKTVSNNIKYRDTGKKGTVGRAGGFELEPRAMLGKDGITVVEVTTGTFEAQSDALIDRISIKVAGSDAPAVQERPGTSTWSYEMFGLIPNDQLEFQAHLKAFEGKRNVVLRATAPVVRRPDVATLSLDGPAQTHPDVSVIFLAHVRELNGDLGARANCTLWVNGVAVDQAQGIWIDANDVVTCRFAYLFSAAGTYTVSVSASDVVPGDWDLANNVASHTVTVVDRGTPIAFGQITAIDQNYTYSTTTTRVGFEPVVANGARRLSSLGFSGTSVQTVPGPLQRLTAKISVDGGPIFETTLTMTNSWQIHNGGSITYCEGYADASGQTAQWCRGDFLDGTKASFSYDHSSGSVTYYGQTLFCSLRNGCNVRDENMNAVTGTGQRYNVNFNSLLRLELSWVDAAGDAHVIDRQVGFQDFSASENYDVSGCTSFPNVGQVCTRRVSAGTSWRGVTTW